MILGDTVLGDGLVIFAVAVVILLVFRWLDHTGRNRRR
jgi:hypothetical protein